jgi:hypothetical protein
MSNGDKIPLEKAKRGSEARKKFIAVRQKYGDPESLELEALETIKTAYDEFTDEMSKLKLKLTGESQSEMKDYMDRVDTCYNAFKRPAETENVIDAEVIEENKDVPDDRTDYQTIAPEADEPAYDAPVPKTVTETDLRAQAKEKFKHFDVTIERTRKFLEEFKTRNMKYQQPADKQSS